MIPEAIEPHLVWLSFGILLCIAEMIIPGVFLIWLGLAALVTGAAAYLLPMTTGLQLGLFAALAIASVFVGRRWSAGKDIATDDPMLNDRLARMVGEPVVVKEAIVAGRGRVRVGDGVWPATGADAPVGTRLHVTGANGGVLTVEG